MAGTALTLGDGNASAQAGGAPTVVAPVNGTRIEVVNDIVFRVRAAPGIQWIWLQVYRSPPSSCGTSTGQVALASFDEISPGLYEKKIAKDIFDSTEWTSKPGTYYWQAGELGSGAACTGPQRLDLFQPPRTARIRLDSSCYREESRGTVRGSGFRPGAVVNVDVPGHGRFSEELVTVTAGAAGAFTKQFPTPDYITSLRPQPLAIQRIKVKVSEDQRPWNAAEKSITVAGTGMSVVPTSGSPSRRVTIRLTGFTRGRSVYAHYTRGLVSEANVRLGRVRSTCKVFTVRRRWFPMSHPGNGVWRIAFDMRRRYDPQTTPQVSALVRVSTVRISTVG